MRCIRCLHPKSRVKGVRKYPKHILRLRKCASCGFAFHTIETIPGVRKEETRKRKKRPKKRRKRGRYSYKIGSVQTVVLTRLCEHGYWREWMPSWVWRDRYWTRRVLNTLVKRKLVSKAPVRGLLYYRPVKNRIDKLLGKEFRLGVRQPPDK